MKKRKRQKGFTLLELTITTFTGAIVIVAAGMILFFGQKTWNSTWDRTNLQRDASYAMLRISRDIKAGASAQVQDAGSTLTVNNGSDWVRFYTEAAASSSALKYQTSDGGSETILADNLQSVQFNVTDNMVAVNLTMQQDNLQTNFASTVMMRNYGQ
jgi:type II secretory pathway component PulJ